MWWKSLWFTFTVGLVGSFSFARAWGSDFHNGCYWGVGMACVSLTIHRLFFLGNGKGL